MFDYLVLIETEKGMLHFIWSAKEIAKHISKGYSSEDMRAYILKRNQHPMPVWFDYLEKQKQLYIYDGYSNFIEHTEIA